jgi:hypothetical protein
MIPSLKDAKIIVMKRNGLFQPGGPAADAHDRSARLPSE